MADVFIRAKRSQVMSRIRSRGNRDTELALMKLFRRHGITGWRRHREVRGARCEARGQRSEVRGQRAGERMSRSAGQIRDSKIVGRNFRVRPDFVFARLKLAVFVDGCFWHACPKHSEIPANNRVFWKRKLAANQARDRLVTRTLRRAGWRVMRLWEHDLARRHEPRLLARLQKSLAPGASRRDAPA